jgi:regulatory protein
MADFGSTSERSTDSNSEPSDVSGADSKAEAYASAIRVIAIREHSSRELKLKLRKRGYADDVISAVDLELKQAGLLDDARFAVAYLRSRLQRMFGPLRIRAELRGKGIKDDVIVSVLNGLDDDWDLAAFRWVTKRGDDVSQHAHKARVYRSLVNRGFSHAQAMKALNSFINTV